VEFSTFHPTEGFRLSPIHLGDPLKKEPIPAEE
jgi:hypothetical protein